MRDRVYGPWPEVIGKFGVPPEQVRDLLALVGDTSDNIPGVKSDRHQDRGRAPPPVRHRRRDLPTHRRGEARAASARRSSSTRPTQDLAAARHVARRRRGRARSPSRSATAASDTERLREMFTDLGFTRFVKMLPPAKSSEVKLEGADKHRVVIDETELAAFAVHAKKNGEMAIEMFTTSREAMRGTLIGIALAARGAGSIYILSPIATSASHSSLDRDHQEGDRTAPRRRFGREDRARLEVRRGRLDATRDEARRRRARHDARELLARSRGRELTSRWSPSATPEFASPCSRPARRSAASRRAASMISTSTRR